MSEAYRALKESAAWFRILGRGRIRAAGADRARLLHALCTNHVQQLAPGEGCYAFFLNAQGRIQADAHILCFEDHFLIDTEPESRERLFAHIDRYIIADDVTIEDRSDSISTLAIEGPRSGEILERLGAPAPETPYAWAPLGDRWMARLDATGGAGFWILSTPEDLETLSASLDLPEASAEDIRTVRVENGKPRYGEDIFDTIIPHETRLMHAVHFNKGCYLGQEIVERVRSRGRVNKELWRLSIASQAVPERGAKVLAGGKEAGEITTAVFSPAHSAVLAFAYMRVEHLRPNAEFEVNGAAARIFGQ